ncbi:MAG: hypothetical protein HKP30_02640, partial [Myxococcales bacterium]|nr:hypothetical protein [Myxococcales bacterium]
MTFQTATRRLAAVPLGLALALALGAPGARAETAIPPDQGACAVLDSPFTLAEIVEAALAEEPGTVKAAGFTVRPDGMGGRTTLFKVRIRTDDGPRLLFHDLETGERVFPVE